jgi:outer membrane protein insertion porin family
VPEPAPQGAHAADPAAQAPLLGVDVLGLTRLEPATALGKSELRVGDLASRAAIAKDLRRLWSSGFFRNVEAYLEPRQGGVWLHWWVQEKPSIRHIEIRGRDALSDEDVRGAIGLKPNTILNTEALKRNAEKVRELYVGKGYFLAHVEAHARAIDGDKNEVDVVFELRESDKVSVRGITFLGNHRVPKADLLAVMQTAVGHELGWLTQAGTYKEQFLENDILRLQALYYDRGFVAVKIGEPELAISVDKRHVFVTLHVEEGEQYRIGRVRAVGEVSLPKEAKTGRPAIDADAALALTRSKQGAIFNRSRLFEDVQALTDLYRDRGYAYANVSPNSEVDADKLLVNIDLEVERGDEVTIERIDMRGNHRTRDKVIRREMALHEGDRFDGAAMNLSRAHIFQLGFFENVELETLPGSAPDRMKVVVQVKEKSTGTFQVGAGFSSVENFIATAQISQNNFLGNGQLLSLSMQLSFGAFARQLANFQYFDPYFLDSQWSFGLLGFLQQRYYRDFQRNSVGFSPTLGYPLTHNLRLSGAYSLENVRITADNASTQAVLYNLNRNGRVSSLSGTLAYDTRNNRLLPSKGMYHEAKLEWSSPYLGAEPQMAFKRGELTARLYAPIAWHIVFRMNLQLGWVFGSPGGSVPISERYFPGGIYSVRGFAPRELGPSLRVPYDTSNPASGTRDFLIGGNKQIVSNFELEFPIVPAAQLKGVVFVDAGNAYNDDEALLYAGRPKAQRQCAYLLGSDRPIPVPAGLYYSFGVGVRWLSPIGPLRFEYGFPITKRMAGDRNAIFEFTIGNFF